MKVARTWQRPAGQEDAYIFDMLRPMSAPQSLYALLSTSKLRVVPSIESDHFVDIVLNSRRVTGIACSDMSCMSRPTTTLDNLVWCCSGDGAIAAWDLQASQQKPAINARLAQGMGSPVYSTIGIGMGGSLVAAGTEEGVESRILFFDVRDLTKPLAIFAESHSDSITNLCFSPLGTSVMLSGSMDGLVCAFDLSKSSESSALSSVLNANSTCSRIGFFGANYEGVYATTTTETLSVFELESSETVKAFEYDLAKGTGCRETLQELSGMEINYLIDCLYEPKTQKLIVMAGNAGGDAFGFELRMDGFHRIGELPKGHSEVIRCSKLIDLDGGRGLGLITGGEDGRICLWSATG